MAFQIYLVSCSFLFFILKKSPQSSPQRCIRLCSWILHLNSTLLELSEVIRDDHILGEINPQLTEVVQSFDPRVHAVIRNEFGFVVGLIQPSKSLVVIDSRNDDTLCVVEVVV